MHVFPCSKDVIRRWSHPMVPDNLTAEGEGYKLGRHNVYLASNVTLERLVNLFAFMLIVVLFCWGLNEQKQEQD